MALGAGWTPHIGSVGWDDLRKQARRLESELDVKLSSFRKLKYAPAVDGQRDGNEAAIERLLQQLNDVNTHMQNWVSGAASDVLSHTLARHQNILHELSQEFARIRVSTRANREHAELLQFFNGADESKSFLDDAENEMQQQSLLREQATINRSAAQSVVVQLRAFNSSIARAFSESTKGLRGGSSSCHPRSMDDGPLPSVNCLMIDSVIGQAQEAYNALRYQRTSFGNVFYKIKSLGSRLPLVNKVLTAVRRRKSRDALMVGAVISICMILIILYWLVK